MTTPLVPPTIPRPSSPPEPNWWFSGHDAQISRNKLHKRWISDVLTSEPVEKKTFGLEMNAWAGKLADTDWVAIEFHRTAPTLLGTAEKSFGDVDGWNSVSAITAAFTVPLSFYTTGWYGCVAALRPEEELPSKVCGKVREMARRVARPVRDDMVESGVIGTSMSAEQFIANHCASDDVDADGDFQRHARIALSEYKFRLEEFINGLALQDSPPAGLRRTMARHYLDIVAELSDVSDELVFDGDGDVTEVDVSGWLSSIVPGQTIPGSARRSKAGAISTDRLNGWPSLLDAAGRLESLLRNIQWRADARIHIARDRSLRDGDDLVWEAEFAMAFLADSTADFSNLVPAVAVRWAAGRPHLARSTSPDGATRDVQVTLVAALNAVRRPGGS